MADAPAPTTSPIPSAAALLAHARQLWPLGLMALLLALAFREHFVWLVQKGWHNEYYSHGWLMPVVAGYLVYRRWAEVRALPARACWVGLPLLALGLAVHAYAIYKDFNFPQGFALVCCLAGLVIWLWGWPVGRALAFPLSYLMFAVPMGRVLVDKFAQPMQLMSAHMAGTMAAFMGIPVQVEGTAINLPDFRFEVVVACSGLKSIIAMTALGALYAYAVAGPLWKRWVLFLSAIPAAVLANGFRIWLTLVLSRSLGGGAAEGFFHTVSGMVVFLVALILLFGMGSLLGCNSIRDEV